MNMKIRLTVVIGLLAAIILAVLVSVLTIRARAQLLESAMRDVEQTALSVADQVARWEEIVVTTSEAVSMNPRVRAMDPDGHVMAFAGALPALDRYVYTMYSIDSNGTQFILDNGEPGSGYRGDRTYFTEAMERGRIASQVLMGRSLEPPAPAVAYGIPIFSPEEDGRPVGVLLVASTLSEVSRIVQNNVGKGVANAYVVDPGGRLVAHSSASLLEGDELVDYTNHPPVRESIAERSQNVYRYQDEGRTMVSRNAEVGNGWTVFVEAEEASVMAAAAAFTTIGTIMSIAGLLLLVVVLWSVISFNLKPLTLLADRFEAYAEGGGDLTTRIAIKRNDEIGQVGTHFNAFVGVLNTLVSSVKATVTEAIEQKETVSASTTEVASSADEISATVQSIRSRLQQLSDEAAESSSAADEIETDGSELMNRVGEQASAVEQSSAAIEQMVASIRTVASTAEAKQDSLLQLQTTTEKGRGEVQATEAKVSELAASVKTLQEIVTVINDIASQTNILSMNAAIEAAHAGDQGKGFAVVAQEIRSLAESASKNSKTVSESLQKNANDIASLKKFADNVFQHYASVEGQIETVREAFEEITGAMRELSAGTEEIGKAVFSLREATNAVETGASRISKRGKLIGSHTTNVNNVSSELLNGMSEIDSGTTEISSAMQDLTNAVTRLSETIADIGTRVEQFRTSEEG